MLASLPPCETHLQSNQARGTVLVCISTQVQTLLTSLNVCVTFRPLALGGAAPSDLHRPLDLTRIKYIPKHTGVVPSGKTPGFRTWLLDQIWGILVTAARELGLAGLILVFCHMLPSLNHKTLPLLLQNKDDSQVPPCPASPWLPPVCACTALPSAPSLLWDKTLVQPLLGGQGRLSLPTTYWLPQAAQGGSALPSGSSQPQLWDCIMHTFRLPAPHGQGLCCLSWLHLH